jgi:3-deoxy-D-arabino-heptulosonate 7-phosphate (DAHP) synthase class II
MDLLDEIQSDPEFMTDTSESSEIAKLSFRLSKMYMEHEALLLILRAKKVITEDEYQKAIHHIVEETKQMDESIEINEDYINNVDKKFKEILKKGD